MYNYLLNFFYPKEDSTKKNLIDISNKIIKAFNIIKNTKIELLNKSVDLYENDLFKVIGKVEMGAGYVPEKNKKQKSSTIEFKESKCTNDEGLFFAKIINIYQQLNKLKENSENLKKVITNFKEEIGSLIITGKLYIVFDFIDNEIKLIFEISNKYNIVDIFGTFELVIKFKKPVIKRLRLSSNLIFKNNPIDTEEKLYFGLLGIVATIALEDDDNVLSFLNYLNEIENDKNIKQDIKNIFDMVKDFNFNLNLNFETH